MTQLKCLKFSEISEYLSHAHSINKRIECLHSQAYDINRLIYEMKKNGMNIKETTLQFTMQISKVKI